MKKILFTMLLSLFFIFNTFAYEVEDWVKMIEDLKIKLEDTNYELKINEWWSWLANYHVFYNWKMVWFIYANDKWITTWDGWDWNWEVKVNWDIKYSSVDYLLKNFTKYSESYTSISNVNNECKAKDFDDKTFFTCLKEYTQKNKNSFGKFNWTFVEVDITIDFIDDKIIYNSISNWYINKCNIKLSDKSKFINALDKWSNTSFWTSDLEYATCVLEQVNSNKEELAKIDIADLEIIEENSSYKLLKWLNKWYLYNIANKWLTINWKQLEDSLCEITWSNWEWLKYIWSYLVDNKNIYDDKSSIDYQSWNYLCEINKINHNLDIKTLKYLDKSNLYKDNNWIYYFHWWSFWDLKIIKLENIDELTIESLWGGYYKDKNWVYYFSDYWDFNKLEKVDLESFELLDDFSKKAQDNNYIYIRWKIDKERVKLIKKDNITIDDFEIKNEKLTPWIKSKIAENYWKIYDFSYESDINTNIEWNFMWKINLWGGSSVFNEFEEWESRLYNKFYINDKTTIVEFMIDIYNKDKAEFSFQDWEKIWTIKRKIKFTTDMDKPIFINDEKNKNNEKVDLLLEKLDQKISNKSLKIQLDTYKNIKYKLKDLKPKFTKLNKIDLFDYLYDEISKKYLTIFKSYVLQK